MERVQANKKCLPDQACQQVFGVTYKALAHGISEFWHLPASITNHLGAKQSNGDNQLLTIIQLASDISDMLFGNAPGGKERMAAAEKRMQSMLKIMDFTIERFVHFACEADENIHRFFKLDRQDIEMMVRIAEWGKVNSADVAASLTMGFEHKEKETQAEDPKVLIGNFLSELMLSLRKRRQINEILMIGQEAIYRCLAPTCVFTMFLDRDQRNIVGRLYAGHNMMIRASELRVPVSLRQSPVVIAMESMKGNRIAVKTNKNILPHEMMQKLKLEHMLIAPIVARDKAIGAYLVGRSNDDPFVDEEQVWLDAISGNIGLAFEQTAESATR